MLKTKYIKRVLMCRPDFYSVDYIINPWMMPKSVNKTRAIHQWENLVRTYKKLGIEVDIINQVKRLPDMVFSTDCGINIDNTFLMSNFKYPQRRGEQQKYARWLKKNNITLTMLTDEYLFEGGDFLWWKDILFAGTGFRTSPLTIRKLERILNMNIIELILMHAKFYHLDTCFFPLNNTTAFYYPDAFSVGSQKKLKELIPNLIAFTDYEANHFASNSVVTDHHVVMHKGIDSFKDKIRDLDYKAVEVDVSEFIKSGGGIHCLTQVLQHRVNDKIYSSRCHSHESGNL